MGKRGNWQNWFEFLFSCIGCLVGLGNIWRFPYLCYKNGGGAFLIPYFIFIFLCALPLFFLEMSYAQFSNLGPGRVWICCPLFKGVGYGMVMLTGIVAIYYNVILAWTLYYFGMSFSSTLPWSTCNNEWNTEGCYLRRLTVTSVISSNETHVDVSAVMNSTSSVQILSNFTLEDTKIMDNATRVDVKKTATEEFWERNVLELTSGVEEPGYIRWQLFLCLLAAWILVFLCLIKGIKSSGKVMYVAATVPYLLLLVLLIRGAMLPGAIDGIKYYVIPRWESLLSVTVWGDAAVQVFYSAGLGWGGIITLASYNDFHNNIQRDALFLPVIDAVTSWFSGFVIFVSLGFMSHATGLDIDKVVSQGPGIAFMVYPEALSKLPLPQLWSVLFFVMLFTVGLDSQIVHVQTITGALLDTFPHQLLKRKLHVTFVVCFVLFLFGLSCVTQGGVYVLQILDWYCASVTVMLLTLIEIVVLCWVYGVKRLYRDAELMLGVPPYRFWKYFWLFITPLCILLIWCFNLSQMKPVKYGDTSYPSWAIGVGWVVALLSFVPVPVLMALELRKRGGPLLQRIKDAVRPSPKWGPVAEEYKAEYSAALQSNCATVLATELEEVKLTK